MLWRSVGSVYLKAVVYTWWLQVAWNSQRGASRQLRLVLKLLFVVDNQILWSLAQLYHTRAPVCTPYLLLLTLLSIAYMPSNVTVFTLNIFRMLLQGKLSSPFVYFPMNRKESKQIHSIVSLPWRALFNLRTVTTKRSVSHQPWQLIQHW